MYQIIVENHGWLKIEWLNDQLKKILNMYPDIAERYKEFLENEPLQAEIINLNYNQIADICQYLEFDLTSVLYALDDAQEALVNSVADINVWMRLDKLKAQLEKIAQINQSIEVHVEYDEDDADEAMIHHLGRFIALPNYRQSGGLWGYAPAADWIK